MKHDFGILMLSYDGIADLWKPFFAHFFKNWEDCPYPVYLGTNTVGYDDARVKVIYSGEDIDWSTSFKSILQQIPHKSIFILYEDHFITSKIDTEKVAQCVQFMEESNAKHIHIEPLPKPDRLLSSQNLELGVYEKGAPYRVNELGFWDREYLMNLLLEGENCWNFEIQGSYRSSYDKGFFCLIAPLYSFVDVIEKKLWRLDGIDYCKKHDIEIDIGARPVAQGGKSFQSKLQMYYFNLMIKVPWKFRVKLMNILRKLLISY